MHLRHLSSDCAGLLERLYCEDDRPYCELPAYELIEKDPATDPVYEVAESDKLIKTVKAPKLPDAGEYAPSQEMF